MKTKSHCDVCKMFFKPKYKKQFICSRSCQVSWLWKKKKIKPVFGRVMSKQTRQKISNSLKNEKHFNWKKIPTYGIVHYWLRQNFGLPQECENNRCERKSKTFDWALIRGKKYDRCRKNFIRLCRKCHTKYDKNINFNIDSND